MKVGIEVIALLGHHTDESPWQSLGQVQEEDLPPLSTRSWSIAVIAVLDMESCRSPSKSQNSKKLSNCVQFDPYHKKQSDYPAQFEDVHHTTTCVQLSPYTLDLHSRQSEDVHHAPTPVSYPSVPIHQRHLTISDSLKMFIIPHQHHPGQINNVDLAPTPVSKCPLYIQTIPDSSIMLQLLGPSIYIMYQRKPSSGSFVGISQTYHTK